MSYVGRAPEYGGYEKQVLTADGSTTTFSLDYSVGSESSLLVSVAGVNQIPGTAYNLSGGGSNIVFSAAPASSATVFVIFLGYAFDSGALLGTGTITGQTEVTTLASADEFLVYDNSASGLRRVAYSNVHTGEADMEANTVKVRDAASTGSPSNKTVADTQLLIGDGTGFTAAALSSDVTMANTGAVTIANNAINAAKLADDAVDTDAILDNNVTLAKLADGTQGDILYYGASGAPALLGVGTSGQFLKTQGASANPIWATVTLTTINTNAATRVITGSGTADTLNGESGLTFGSQLLTVTGAIEPEADNTRNLGDTNKRWANVYSSDVHLNNTGTSGNEVDGSEGSWTIQEGFDSLFLLNRLTGKKYKFLLEEV